MTKQASGNGDYILIMKDIYKHFGGLVALDQVNLRLRRNEILGLVGDNGAGKSTLMKIITGAYQPDGGEVFFDGDKVDFRTPLDSRNAGIEMVYQHLALCKNLDVVSNVFLAQEKSRGLLGPFIRILDRKRMEKETRRIIENLKINVPDISAPTGTLSGGQQQAVAIARSTSFDPRMIILDEPTAALALKEVAKALRLIRDLRDQGISIIMISHRLEDIFACADRIMVLRGGKRVGVWPTSELTMDDIVRYMFLGDGENNGESLTHLTADI